MNEIKKCCTRCDYQNGNAKIHYCKCHSLNPEEKKDVWAEFDDYFPRASHGCDDMNFHKNLIKDFIRQYFIPKSKLKELEIKIKNNFQEGHLGIIATNTYLENFKIDLIKELDKINEWLK